MQSLNFPKETHPLREAIATHSRKTTTRAEEPRNAPRSMGQLPPGAISRRESYRILAQFRKLEIIALRKTRPIDRYQRGRNSLAILRVYKWGGAAKYQFPQSIIVRTRPSPLRFQCGRGISSPAVIIFGGDTAGGNPVGPTSVHSKPLWKARTILKSYRGT